MKAEKISLEHFLFRKGVGFPVDDYMIDKLKIPHGLTQRQEEKLAQEAMKSSNEYHEKRRKAIAEYKELVQKGEIIEPTPLEKRIQTAKGHPDNPSVQAARRLLKKQGIDWENCP